MGTSIGTLYVRRSIYIEASPTRVWQEFQTFEHIARWLNLGHTLHVFEPRVGGQVQMSVEIDNEERFFGGTVLVFAAGQELTFDVQWQAPHNWPVPMYWTIRLSSLYGGTQVEIFHHGFERLRTAASDNAAADNLEAYESGWDSKHLRALRALISPPKQ